jgi:transcriptional regulator with XRE-family HTH domain
MMQRFGEKLRILREGQGLSQKQLAEHLQLTHAYINYLENGKRTPGVETLMAVSQMFHVTIDTLVWDELELDLEFDEGAAR